MAKTAINPVTGMEATQVVSRTLFNQEVEEREHITIRPFATVPAKVAVKLGRTINLGNYESARVDVSMEIPCYREEVLDVYPQLFDQVAGLMAAEVNKIAGAGQGTEIGVEEIL